MSKTLRKTKKLASKSPFVHSGNSYILKSKIQDLVTGYLLEAEV